MRDNFTICAMFYGDYLPLAQRCIESIREHVQPDWLNLRVGSNEVGSATFAYLGGLVQQGVLKPENWYDSRENIHKYPLMRRMLHDPDNRIATPYVMWFDDDSFCKPRSSPRPWLESVYDGMQIADMLGGIYEIPWQGHQRDWVRDQSWYNGKDPSLRSRIKFCTGGWWCIKTSVLYQYDYPWPSLDHRGGDTMLGEMLYQQGFKIGQYRRGVAINADANGVECKAKRRGFDSRPIGADYDPGVAVKLAAVESTAQQLLPKITRPKRRIIDL